MHLLEKEKVEKHIQYKFQEWMILACDGISQLFMTLC